jgi:hypothetical protein
LCAVVSLAGCSKGSDSDALSIFSRSAVGLISDFGQRNGILGARDLSATDAQLRSFTSPLIKVTRAKQGVAAGLVLSDTKGPATTWRSTDGKTVTLFDGSLISTKSFGNDLSSARVPGVRAGDSDVLREHFYLGGDEVMRRKQYFCDFRDAGRETINLVGVSVATTRIVETCKGDEDQFENSYWFGPDGGIVKVAQWASPEIGLLVIELVPRDGGGGAAAVAPAAVRVAPTGAEGVVLISGSPD